EDHALAKARRDTETDALRQLVEHAGKAALVARFRRRDAISHHDPVDRGLARHQALLAAFPNEIGIETGLLDLETLRIDARKKIEIHEAVVHRRDQRVGGGMAEAG